MKTSYTITYAGQISKLRSEYTTALVYKYVDNSNSFYFDTNYGVVSRLGNEDFKNPDYDVDVSMLGKKFKNREVLTSVNNIDDVKQNIMEFLLERNYLGAKTTPRRIVFSD